MHKDGVLSFESQVKRMISLLINAIKPAQQDMQVLRHYLINNTRFVIWIVAYIFILWANSNFRIQALMMLFIMYYFSIKIAISELGESLLRAIKDCRSLATSKEKSRLLPLFDETYQKSLEKAPYLDKDIQLYIIDTITPNAFAVGKKSIIVTNGVMDIMTDEEIKAMLAHEFGHIANGDTLISLIFTIGNLFFLWTFLLVQVIVTKIEQHQGQVAGFLQLVKIAVWIVITVFNVLGVLLLVTNSRQSEYRADVFAYELGYGSSLISGLYKLYDYTLSKPKKVFARMQETHPRIAYRIGSLEDLQEES